MKKVIPLGKSTTYTSSSSLSSLGSALSCRNLISVHTSHSSGAGSCACIQGFTKHSMNQAKIMLMDQRSFTIGILMW